MHPENETRLLSLPVTDTSDQTRHILFAIADENNKSSNLSNWQAFQEWLNLADHEVTIPFAKELANLIPPVAIRLRRDFTILLLFGVKRLQSFSNALASPFQFIASRCPDSESRGMVTFSLNAGVVLLIMNDRCSTSPPPSSAEKQ